MHRLDRLIAVLRMVLARERLPEAAARGGSRRGPGVGSLLFGREPLPYDPVRPALRRGGLSVLFAAEALPTDPPAPARRTTRWLTWMLRVEPLDHD
jgi:hypothetical protein